MRNSQYKAQTGSNLTANALASMQGQNSGAYLQQQAAKQPAVTTSLTSPAPAPAPKTTNADNQGAPSVSNQPSMAGGYVVPNITPTTEKPNYLSNTNTNTNATYPQQGSSYIQSGQGNKVYSGTLDNPNPVSFSNDYAKTYNVAGSPIMATPGMALGIGSNEFVAADQRISQMLGYDPNAGLSTMDWLRQNPQLTQAYIDMRRMALDPSFIPTDEMQMLKRQAAQLKTPEFDVKGITTANLPAGADVNEFLNSLQQQQQQPSNQGVEGLPAIARPENVSLPDTLAYLQNMDDVQRRTAIATDAIAGGGASQDAQNYFLQSMLQNVMDTNNNTDLSGLTPIENQYLNMLGLDTNDTGSDFLRSLQRAYSYGFV